MRAGRVVLVGLVLAAVLAGCGEPVADDDPFTGPQGRACQAVAFDTVEAALGIRFETAASAQVEQSYSCALGLNRQPFPDLVATLTATPADHIVYRATVVPSDFSRVEELGRFGYETVLDDGTFTGNDGSASGPALQIGWLSQSPQMMTLRFTWAAGATADDVAAMIPRLTELAQQIEKSLVTMP